MTNNMDDGSGSAVEEETLASTQQQQQHDEQAIPSPVTPTTTANEDEEQRTFVFHRNWLKAKIQKHSNDERLKQYYDKLHPKYPILKDKALVVAPMVDQSELPFRLLCRRYGANLCFTPMIHARMFQERVAYRNKFWKFVSGMPPEDRPLIVQLCGSDKEALSYTVNYILKAKNWIDGIDLNCGCPQTIAKRGKYGAYLLEMDGGDVIVDVVKHMVKEFGHLIPITVKVRILPSGLEDSLKLYTRLVDAGASMLTVHGRTRLQKGLSTGHADWGAIKQVVDLLGHRVPILSNGSIGNLDDVIECLEVTGADGIMSSEAILEYPALFTETGTLELEGKRTGPGRIQIAREYLALCEEFPPEQGGQGNGVKTARAHLHKFLHKDLSKYDDIRTAICYVEDYSLLWKACDDVEKLNSASGHDVKEEVLSWYMRHRIVDESGVHLYQKRLATNREVKVHELDDEAGDCFNCLFGGGDDDEGCW